MELLPIEILHRILRKHLTDFDKCQVRLVNKLFRDLLSVYIFHCDMEHDGPCNTTFSWLAPEDCDGGVLDREDLIEVLQLENAAYDSYVEPHFMVDTITAHAREFHSLRVDGPLELGELLVAQDEEDFLDVTLNSYEDDSKDDDEVDEDNEVYEVDDVDEEVDEVAEMDDN